MQIRSTGTTHVSDGILTAHTHTLLGYRETLRAAREDLSYASPESALASPSDVNAIHEAEDVARAFGGPALRTLFLVGIGGSDLGTRAIYNALSPHRSQHHAQPQLIAYDTVDPKALSHVRELLSEHNAPEEIVCIVISKSGTTAETIANANVLFQEIVQRFGDVAAAARTIVISDSDVPLASEVLKHSIRHVAMPKQIGGRFSVFTAVGLVPLALLGVDVRSLCEGAARAILAATPEQGAGPGAMLAALLFEQYLNGLNIHELFMFHPELETMGKWYRQLLAESIGKERADGTRVGITPTVAIGSTDLHSLGQLVLGGPKNRFTTFVAAPEEWGHTPSYTEESPFTLSMLAGKEVGAVMQSIYGGVQHAYRNQNIPFVAVELAGITPGELGAFMGLQMATVMYLGKLFDVNTFDQPAVETYKSEARRLLTT